ncbi:MAG: hypothetical protein ACRD5H_11960, partial [Nitrososphaerales archaeon]
LMISSSYAMMAVIFVLVIPVFWADAQTMEDEGLKKVEGKYANPDVGVEMDLPEDWSGFEMSMALGPMETLMVAAAPGGIDPEAMMSMMPEKPMIMLAVLSMAVTEDMESTDNPPQLSQEGMECTPATFRTVKVSDVDSLEAIIECTSIVDGKEVHAKGKTFFMNQESAEKTGSVTVMFAAPSDMYDASVNEFDESMKTLKIKNASAFKLTMDNLLSESFTVSDDSADVKAESSSEVSNLSFSEMDKSISLDVSGDDGTVGITTAYVGSIIKEPYVVTIDDNPANFEVVTDENGVKGVKVVYLNTMEVQSVTVAGSEVIPEFPLVAIAVMGVMVAIIIAMSRFSHKYNHGLIR